MDIRWPKMCLTNVNLIFFYFGAWELIQHHNCRGRVIPIRFKRALLVVNGFSFQLQRTSGGSHYCPKRLEGAEDKRGGLLSGR